MDKVMVVVMSDMNQVMEDMEVATDLEPVTEVELITDPWPLLQSLHPATWLTLETLQQLKVLITLLCLKPAAELIVADTTANIE